MTFEDKMKKLEELNSLIKNRETSLDEAMKAFDQGVALATELEGELKKAERKVELLINKPRTDGSEDPLLDLFEENP